MRQGTSSTTVSLSFGALAPPLRKQLAAHGLSAPSAVLSHWQRDADAVARLFVRGLLTHTSVSRARRLLVKHICANTTPHGANP